MRVKSPIALTYLWMNMATNVFIKFDAYKKLLLCQGDWTFQNIIQLRKQFKKISLIKQGNMIIDGDTITKMDSAGASFFTKWIAEIQQKGTKVQLQNFHEQNLKLMTRTLEVAL